MLIFLSEFENTMIELTFYKFSIIFEIIKFKVLVPDIVAWYEKG